MMPGAPRACTKYMQRIQKAWGHTAHRGWARLLLNRARELIIHDPAHHGANGAAMPTDEEIGTATTFQPPREGGLTRCLGTRSNCYCCLDPIPPTEARALESHSAGSDCHLRRRWPWYTVMRLLRFGARCALAKDSQDS